MFDIDRLIYIKNIPKLDADWANLWEVVTHMAVEDGVGIDNEELKPENVGL